MHRLHKRKLCICIYIVYLLSCIILTVRNAGQKQVIQQADRYGLEAKDTICLDPEAEAEVEFCLSRDNFEGIGVSFKAEEAFGDEKIRASLYDADTCELLADDVIEMKYESIRNTDGGSYLNFVLPVESAEDRPVRLVLTLEGKRTGVFPNLVLSKKIVEDSVLTYNGEQQDQDLNFIARYTTGTVTNTAKAFTTGILYILAGTLALFCAFVWPGNAESVGRSRQDARHSAAKAAGSKDAVDVNVIGHRWTKYAGMLFWLCFTGFLFVYVYQYGVESVIRKENAYFLKRMYLVLCLMLLVFAAVLYYYCFLRRLRLSRLFAVLAISMGVCIGSVIALYTVPDEPSHIDSAYCLSNEILGIPGCERPGHIYKRAEDFEPYAESVRKLGIANYRDLYDGIRLTAGDVTLVECSAMNNFSNAGRIYYLPQALGLCAGRLLKLGTVPMLLLGRLFSLLAYVVIVCLAIRKIPFAKVSLVMIAMLPISLQQAASFSYDAMINAVAFLFVSYCLYISYDDREIRAGDLLVILVTGCMLATVKGGVYLPLCFLPLLALLSGKAFTKRQKLSIAAIVILCLLCFANGRLSSTIAHLATEQGTVTGGAKGSEVYTFGYLLRYPQRLIGMFVNTFYEQGDAYVRNLLGGNLAWRDINISWFIVFGFLLVILMSVVGTGKKFRVSGTQKAYIGLLCFGSFGLLELSMLLAWTPVTLNYITGVQGRYFLPFFPLLLVILKNSFFRIRKNIDYVLIFVLGALDILTVLQVVQRALER